MTEYRGVDLHSDVCRFLVTKASIEAGRERFVTLVHWSDELERRVGR